MEEFIKLIVFFSFSYIEVIGSIARFDNIGQRLKLEDYPKMLKMGKWELIKNQISQLKILWFHESNGKNIEWKRVVTLYF